MIYIAPFLRIGETLATPLTLLVSKHPFLAFTARSQHFAVLFLMAAPLWLAAQDQTPPPAVETPKNPPRSANRLAKEKSPYLQQHAHNPVDWFPWGEEAFAKAKKEDKPIFLSIGYSTCHWCHVMERESFENEELGKYLSEHFVCIKLDREERPDVDTIYMTAAQAMKWGSGWPLNIFLTPDREPFFGGTYFPPDAFKKILDQVVSLWAKRREDLVKDAKTISTELGRMMEQREAQEATIKKEWPLMAAAAFARSYDKEFGGFNDKPKFPQPKVAELVLLSGAKTERQTWIDQVLSTCRRMAAGGIYDQIGGGFARYSVDEKWLVPHFEKMLYDNAQLVELYLNAYAVSGDASFAALVRDVLRYLLRDMTHADGGFYSAEDADSEGHEGKFYTWTKKELESLLTEEEAKFALPYFGVTEKGNFVDHSHPNPLPNQNVLSILNSDAKLSEANQKLLGEVKAKLFTARAKRIRPHLDDKILVSWNGLLLAALSRAGTVLDEPTYLAAARKNLAFVKSKMWDASQKTLYHRYREGHRDSAQLLTAYAYYLYGVIEYYQCTLEPEALSFALDLAEGMIAKFFDSKAGGFFSSASEGDLIFRAKDDYDGAEPAGNSLAVFCLVKLSTITDRADLRAKAEKSLKLYASRLEGMPQAVPCMLLASSFYSSEPFRVVIAGDPQSPEAKALIKAAHSTYQPEKVVLGTAGRVEEFARSLSPKDSKPTAYVCTGKACQPPTHNPADLPNLLKFSPAKKE